MPPLSPALFVAAANALHGIGCAPREPGTGATSAAFIAHVGYWSHRHGGRGSSWPFPMSADCNGLARIAKRGRVLSDLAPQVGAIYLKRASRTGPFVRAGVVLWAAQIPTPYHGFSYDCLLLEGSACLATSEKAQACHPFGTTVHWVRTTRLRCFPILGDRFVSWVDLDARNDTTSMRRAA